MNHSLDKGQASGEHIPSTLVLKRETAAAAQSATAEGKATTMSSGVDHFDAQLMNVTQSNYSNVTEGCERQSADFQYLLLPVVYSLVFVLAMAGNLTALVHFLHTRSVTHPSHIFLVNLCVIDLLFALTLPFNVVYHARRNDWPFGETMCKINGSLFFGNLYGSSLFLMLISLDRYLAVAHPLRALRMRSPKYRIMLSCLVWAVLASVILYLTLRGPLTRPFPGTGHIACMENFSSKSWRGRISSVSLLAAAIGFFLPLLVIATCYPLIACKLLANVQVKEQGTSRTTMSSALSAHHVTRRVQKKALRMVLLVLGVFLVCFAPYHINQLVHTLHRMAVLSGCSAIRFTYPARRVAMALCSLNSCLDPVVYCLASENFHWDRRYWCCGALWRPMGWRNKMNQNLNHLTTIANREQNA